jgi:regulator of protease activity HflC (stomatin/prohibitin superfamily)
VLKLLPVYLSVRFFWICWYIHVYPPDAGVEKAIFLDSSSAVLLLNKTTGFEQVVTQKEYVAAQPGLYVPRPYEYIMQKRGLVRVLPYEAMLLRDQEGKLSIYQGSGTSATNFFIPAYSEVVTMYWSNYAQDAKTPGEKVPVDRIDLRERSMFYRYDVRTNDNVKLRLEGTIFWRIVNVGNMVKKTSDPEGDVWQKSRSALIQAVSQTVFQDFMQSLSNVTSNAYHVQKADTFLADRGLSLEALELTSFECLEDKTSGILQEIIQATINGVKTQELQKSSNDVKQVKLLGDIAIEGQRKMLLETQAKNSKIKAQMLGEAAGVYQSSGSSIFIQGLEASIPNETARVELFRMREKVLARNIDTKSIGKNTGTLFLDPVKANLNLGSTEL